MMMIESMRTIDETKISEQEKEIVLFSIDEYLYIYIYILFEEFKTEIDQK